MDSKYTVGEVKEESSLREVLNNLDDNVAQITSILRENSPENSTGLSQGAIPMSNQKLDNIRVRIINANEALQSIIAGLRHLR